MVTTAPHIIVRALKEVAWIAEITTFKAFPSWPTVVFPSHLLWSVSLCNEFDVIRRLQSQKFVSRVNTFFKQLCWKKRKCAGG